MKLLEIRQEITKNLSYLPEWIDTTSPKHKKIWNLIQHSNEVLLVLIINMILSENAIEKIALRLDGYLCQMIDIINDSELQVMLNIYFMGVIEYMKQVCLENEEYEAATNLRNIYDFIFEPKNKTIND